MISRPVWVLSATGHTLEEAISDLQQEVAEDIFLGQLRVIVINEDVAKNGVDRFNTQIMAIDKSSLPVFNTKTGSVEKISGIPFPSGKNKLMFSTYPSFPRLSNI